jgi:hypothetical protein
MADNIVSLSAGIEKKKKEQTEKEIEHQRMIDETKAAQLKSLDQIKQLIVDDKMEGFVLIGSSPVGAFLTEIAFPYEMSIETTLAYLGALECVRLELADFGQNLPQMLLDGSLIDPDDEEE